MISTRDTAATRTLGFRAVGVIDPGHPPEKGARLAHPQTGGPTSPTPLDSIMGVQPFTYTVRQLLRRASRGEINRAHDRVRELTPAIEPLSQELSHALSGGDRS